MIKLRITVYSSQLKYFHRLQQNENFKGTNPLATGNENKHQDLTPSSRIVLLLFLAISLSHDLSLGRVPSTRHKCARRASEMKFLYWNMQVHGSRQPQIPFNLPRPILTCIKASPHPHIHGSSIPPPPCRYGNHWY